MERGTARAAITTLGAQSEMVALVRPAHARRPQRETAVTLTTRPNRMRQVYQ
jgi:hypothetical protein